MLGTKESKIMAIYMGNIHTTYIVSQAAHTVAYTCNETGI